MSKELTLLLSVIVAAAALYGSYWYGNMRGYDRGLTDAAKIQSGKATEIKIDTGYQNPYQGVNLNPFK